MRSWREALVAAVIATACGKEPVLVTPDAGGAALDASTADCATSHLTYDTIGEPFVADWCRGCHSSGLPANMRQNAPPNVNFDTLQDVQAFQARIVARATGPTPTMPPAGGPSDEERALLGQWLACGAP